MGTLRLWRSRLLSKPLWWQSTKWRRDCITSRLWYSWWQTEKRKVAVWKQVGSTVSQDLDNWTRPTRESVIKRLEEEFQPDEIRHCQQSQLNKLYLAGTYLSTFRFFLRGWLTVGGAIIALLTTWHTCSGYLATEYSLYAVMLGCLQHVCGKWRCLIV